MLKMKKNKNRVKMANPQVIINIIMGVKVIIHKDRDIQLHRWEVEEEV
jgi:hypothetical protein